MKINYSINGKNYSFEQTEKEELEKLNFLLSNNKGDFLNLGIIKNSCKFQGLNICNPKTLDIYKSIEELSPEGLEVKEVKFGGFYIERKFSSKFTKTLRVPVDEEIKTDTFGTEGKLQYDDDGKLIEVIDSENQVEPRDRFYLGPSGGMIYEIFNYEGNVSINIDVKKIFDFDEWGRVYEIYKKENVLFVKYTKTDVNTNEKDYDFYIGIKSVNFAYDLIENWIKKEYSYSKQRSSGGELYTYRLLKFSVMGNKKLVFGTGFSELEVLKQIDLLDKHQAELETFDNNIYKELCEVPSFNKPLMHDVLVAYKLSKNAIYKFLNKNLEKGDLKEGIFAGFPWFSKVWSRDELVGLKAFIDENEQNLTKERLLYYLSKIDEETGEILRIDEKGSLKSLDTLFWLSRRMLDFMFFLDERNDFNKVFSEGELKYIYEKLRDAFHNLIKNSWNSENELLKVKDGDSWMDTIHVEFPLDIQVQLLDFISNISVLASISGNKSDTTSYLDLEESLKLKIRDTYFRDGKLQGEVNEDRISSNIFLAYYLHPGLFLKEEWELIIDSALKELKTPWGGISSLSKLDKRFRENYSGENNDSYHNGDSWYWINNIAAMALNNLNENKYRKEIREIILSSTNDILKMGTVGFGSEISSAGEQKAEGCLAQFWSSSTYLEMIDKLFERKPEEKIDKIENN